MATTKFVNRARMTTDTTGTGSSVNLVVAVPKYFTFSEAGLQDGDVVDYIIEDGDDFEIQHDQTYSSSGPTLSRGTPAASKVGGVAGTSRINLSGGAQVAIVGLAKSFDLSTFTQLTAPAVDDEVWVCDTSAGARRRLALGSIPLLPRAWVAFNGVGTSPTILASHNVSSVARDANGIFTVNFTNAMPDADYCALLSTIARGDGSFASVAFQRPSQTKTTSAFQFTVSDPSQGPYNPTQAWAAFFR